MLESVAMPSSRGSSYPRMEPMSLTYPAFAGGLFTISTTWEAQEFNETLASEGLKIESDLYSRMRLGAEILL